MNRYIVVFIIFSFLGWVWESIYCSICGRKWANRGFLYGPICPIYGFGGAIGLAAGDLALYGILPEMNIWQIFIAAFFVSMILEYPTSYVLEKLFHARWWDYSRLPLNLNGRTSVPTSLAFGLAGILAMKIVIPFTEEVLSLIPDWVLNLLALIFVSGLSVDLTLTVSALTDFQKRVTQIDQNFQNHMTEVVDQLVENRGKFYLNAASRIRELRLPDRKRHIALRLREGKVPEFLEEFYEKIREDVKNK